MPDNISNRLRKQLFNGVVKNENYISTVLIGHLGKYIGTDYVSEISSGEILDIAFSIIEESKKYIVVNNVLVECIDNRKVCNIYESYGFRFLHKDDLLQYIRILNKLAIENCQL